MQSNNTPFKIYQTSFKGCPRVKSIPGRTLVSFFFVATLWTSWSKSHGKFQPAVEALLKVLHDWEILLRVVIGPEFCFGEAEPGKAKELTHFLGHTWHYFYIQSNNTPFKVYLTSFRGLMGRGQGPEVHFGFEYK